MNKRIRELAHEAGLPTYNPDGIPTKLEKFAELIVRECGILADQYNREKYLKTIDPLKTTAYEFIKEHFGVEE